MLMLVMALGEVLFDSRAVGRVGSVLFFFFGSLSYIPFLHKQGSVRGAIQAILHLREFLPTIFPYRGEAWGTWSQVTFLNQRHFASAIGIFLLVLVFLAIQYRAFYAKRAASTPSGKTLMPEPVGSSEGTPETLSGNPPSPESLPVSTSAGPPTQVLELKQPRSFTTQSSSQYGTGLYFLRCSTRASANVEQRGLYRSIRCIGRAICLVSPEGADGRTGDPCRIDRAATDALSEHGKWQDADAKAPSLGLYA